MIVAQAQAPFFDAGWVFEHLDDVWDATQEHLFLTGASVVTGIVISLLLTIVALRWRRLYEPIAAFSGVLYTIPSLAAFALLWPLLGGVRNKELIAIVALTSYTILILVRNFVTGIAGVPSEVVEAARGMGYRSRRRFLEIELPLALPAMIAGIRIATVTVIGLVTVTALIGLGGYGAMILNGLRAGFPTRAVVGIILSVLLASAVDLLLVRIERLVTPWAQVRA